MPTRSGLALASALLFGLCQAAHAHVDYVDLPPGGAAGGEFSNFGWYSGTTAALGDSHDLAEGNFYRFALAQDSRVTIRFSGEGNDGLLNPAFSVYAGLLPGEAHDDTAFDPLNPTSPPPNFARLPSPVDDGVTADQQGRVSPLRDTVNIVFDGQFDALHDWSMANDQTEWSVIQYRAHASPTGGNEVVLSDLFLPAGAYTIAAAGGEACDAIGCLDPGRVPLFHLPGTLSLSVTPVPEPASVWLLAGGMLLLGGFAGVRSRAAGRARGCGMHPQPGIQDCNRGDPR